MNITNEWWWEQVDRIYGNYNMSVEYWEFLNMYWLEGKNAIIYGFANDPKHGAKPLAENCASSKCGPWIRMRHDRNEMEGGDYYGDIQFECYYGN
jgi:hypothetical protein